jgi:hypothetical protein
MFSVPHLQFYETPFSESQFMEIGILGDQGVTVLSRKCPTRLV